MNPILKRAPGRAAAGARWITTFALLSWVASAAGAPPQPTASTARLPAAAEVIAKSVKAIGGREAILKHSSAHLKGTWAIQAQSANGEFEMFQAKPNRRLMRMNLGAMGEIVNAYDGKAGWVLSPFAPPTLVEGKMLEQAREDAEFYSVLHDPTDYKSMDTVARTRFDNRECFELRLVRNSGREIREYYDMKTGLQAGLRGTQESPEGSSDVTVTFQEYQKFSDLQTVTKFRIESSQADISITITSVEYDGVPDTQFEPPAEIKTLLKK